MTGIFPAPGGPLTSAGKPAGHGRVRGVLRASLARSRGSSASGQCFRGAATGSVSKVRRKLGAFFGELRHDLIVQPDIHRSSLGHIAIVMKFLNRSLAAMEQYGTAYNLSGRTPSQPLAIMAVVLGSLGWG